MRNTRSGGALIAAALAVAGMSGFAVSGTTQSPQVEASRGPAARSADQSTLARVGERNAISKALFGGYGGSNPKRFPRGPGWTHAHVQRMTAKRRNQSRNKRAHR